MRSTNLQLLVARGNLLGGNSMKFGERHRELGQKEGLTCKVWQGEVGVKLPCGGFPSERPIHRLADALDADEEKEEMRLPPWLDISCPKMTHTVLILVIHDPGNGGTLRGTTEQISSVGSAFRSALNAGRMTGSAAYWTKLSTG